MRSFCSALSMDEPSCRRLSPRAAQNESGRRKAGREFQVLAQTSAGVASRPAHIHTPLPSGLSQAHQPLRGGFGVGAARSGAGAVFEIGHARHQRLRAEQPGDRADPAVELQLGDRIGDIAGMSKSHDAAGRSVADLINPGSYRRLDMIAARHIWKPFPTAPTLHHRKCSTFYGFSYSENAINTLWFRAVNARAWGAVDNTPNAVAHRGATHHVITILPASRAVSYTHLRAHETG